MADSKKTGQVIDKQTDINWSLSPSLLSLSLPFPSFSIIPLFLYNFFAFLWLLPTFYLGCIPHHSPFAFASAWMIGRSPLSIYDDYYVTLNLYTLIMISLPPSLSLYMCPSVCMSVCVQSDGLTNARVSGKTASDGGPAGSSRRNSLHDISHENGGQGHLSLCGQGG